MSKLNTSNSSFNFFKNNKIKLFAVTGALILSISLCSPINNLEKTKKQEYSAYIKNNINNFTIIKDYENNCYNLTESQKDSGNSKSSIYVHYCIPFEQANELNLTEILEENIKSEMKKEMVLN